MRDCENCKYHVGGKCSQWECIEDVKAEKGTEMNVIDYQEGFMDGVNHGLKKGKADTKSDIAKECKYLLACGMGKKKSLEHLIKILEKEQNETRNH